MLPREVSPPTRPPEDEARDGLDRFRSYLSTIWKQVKAKQRTDLDVRMKEIAGQAGGLSQRLKTDPVGVIRDDKDPPHKFNRDAIEKAIESEGFQLFRMKSAKKKTATAA